MGFCKSLIGVTSRRIKTWRFQLQHVSFPDLRQASLLTMFHVTLHMITPSQEFTLKTSFMFRNDSAAVIPAVKSKFNLETDSDWELMNKHLQDFSYIEGYSLSPEDHVQWNLVNEHKHKLSDYVNIQRWFHHVKMIK